MKQSVTAGRKRAAYAKPDSLRASKAVPRISSGMESPVFFKPEPGDVRKSVSPRLYREAAVVRGWWALPAGPSDRQHSVKDGVHRFLCGLL